MNTKGGGEKDAGQGTSVKQGDQRRTGTGEIQITCSPYALRFDAEEFCLGLPQSKTEVEVINALK